MVEGEKSVAFFVEPGCVKLRQELGGGFGWGTSTTDKL